MNPAIAGFFLRSNAQCNSRFSHLYFQIVNFEGMKSNSQLLQGIKERVHQVAPTARVILFGSFARGDNREESDVDILVLVDNDNITYRQKKEITDRIYDLELETGKIISPIVKPKKEWEKNTGSPHCTKISRRKALNYE
jgi:uncharacterized protein